MKATHTKRGLACVGEDRTLYLVNPAERDYTRHRFVFWFGQIGTIYASVWADNLDDGLEIAGDWLKEYAPGMPRIRYSSKMAHILHHGSGASC